MKKILFIITLLTTALTTKATDYYVSSAGSDSNPGTMAQPWQTKAKVNAGSYAAGDHIKFNGGDTFTGATLLFSNANNSGTMANPVVIESYGTGKATISTTGAVDGFKIYNTGGITIQNVNIDGNTTSGTNGVLVTTDSPGSVKYAGITISGVNITDFDVFVLIESAALDNSPSGFTNVSITNCTMFGGLTVGIGSYGNCYGTGKAHNTGLISGNIIYGVTGYFVSSGNNGSGIVLGETSGYTVQNNIVHDCATNGPGSFAIWCYDSDSIIFQYNEAYNHFSTISGDGGGFDIDGGSTNCVLQYNYSHNNYGNGYFMYAYNDGAVTTWDNNICRYNISVNDGYGNGSGQGGVVVGANSTMTRCYVYNNTCYQSLGTSSTSGFFGSSISSATGIFSNNILYSENSAKFFKTLSSNPSAFTVTGNNYYNTGSFSLEWNGITYTSFASWQAATSKELISAANVATTTNPLLISPGSAGAANYKIQNSSPVSANGLKLPTLYSISVGTGDYFGAITPNSGGNYSVGAHQPIRTTGRIFKK